MRLWLVVLAGCGGVGGRATGDEPGPVAAEGDACSSNADCGAELVCLAYGADQGGCVPTCTASADDCGAEASCGGVGLLEVDVCQDEPSQTEPPEEPPRIPCREDADCQALGADLVCAEAWGVRDCALPCERERDCAMPSVGGFAWDMFTCASDEGDPSRDVCVFDPACLDDPMACLSR